MSAKKRPRDEPPAPDDPAYLRRCNRCGLVRQWISPVCVCGCPEFSLLEKMTGHPATAQMVADTEHALVQIGLIDDVDAVNLLQDDKLIEIKIPWGTLRRFLQEHNPAP